MKSSGICPKCNHTAIYTNAGKTIRGDIRILPVSSWRFMSLDQYICTNCGYTEIYVAQKDLENTALLNKLKSIFTRR